MNPITQFALLDIDLSNFEKQKYSVEESKDYKSLVRIKDEERTIFLGSKYSVKRDVDLFLQQASDYNVNTVFVVFGIGTGEHILELLKIITDKNKILIIEPDKNILALLKTMDCYNTIVEDERVVVSLCDEEKLPLIIRTFIEEFNINNIKLMVFANYDKIYKENFLISYNILKGFVESTVLNINTTKHFDTQFFKCFMKNIKHIEKSAIINEFKDIFKGKPAIIVSAGPSLEKNIDQLFKVKDEFIIFSGGRTIASLKKVGVIPDVVAVVDPGQPSYEVIKNTLDCQAPLVFCEVTNCDVVNEYCGDKIFFQEGFNLNKITSEILGKQVDTLYQGGSVAHTCTSIADYMGCNPIIFIGQDLAFTNGKKHADIASTGDNKISRTSDIFVEDIYGNRVMTDATFNSFRKAFEEFISINKNKVFINSTEGGANIRGTIISDLKETISKYRSNTPIDKEILKSKLNRNVINNEYVLSNLEKILKSIKDIKKDCEKAVKISDELMDFYLKGKSKDIKKLLKFISDLNKRIEGLEIINNLLQPVYYEILMDPKFSEKQGESEKEKGIKLAKQTKKLYSNIVKAINEADPMLEQCINDLKY